MLTHFISKISRRTRFCPTLRKRKLSVRQALKVAPISGRAVPAGAARRVCAERRSRLQAARVPIRTPPGRAEGRLLTSRRRRRAEVRTGLPGYATSGDLQLRSLGISFHICRLGLRSLPRPSARPAPRRHARPAPHRPRAALPSRLLWAARGSGRGASSAPSAPGGKARPAKAGGDCSKSEPPLRGRPLNGRPSAAMAGEARSSYPRPRPPTSPGPAAAATANAEASTSEPALDLTSRLLEPSTPGRPGARRDLLCVESPLLQGMPGVAVLTDYKQDGYLGLFRRLKLEDGSIGP